MKRYFRDWLRKQNEDFQEFMVIIGIKTITQQITMGVVIGLSFIIFACCLAEWLESQY